MMSTIPRWAGLLALCLAPTSKMVQAVGFFSFPTDRTPIQHSGESVLFGVNEDGTVTMHLQVSYAQESADDSSNGEFGWILPLPSAPTNPITVGSELLLSTIFDKTLPTFVLDIRYELSETCNLDEVMPFNCPPLYFVQSEEGDSDSQQGDQEAAQGTNPVTMLDQGTAGMLDYTIFEASSGDISSVMQWLSEQGYAQPPNTNALLQYYSDLGFTFVAFKLQTSDGTGDGVVEPLVITYNLPENDNERALETQLPLLSSLPLHLTAQSATNPMPLHITILTQDGSRAVPLNYADMVMDDALVDWVGCHTDPPCYDADYRERFEKGTEWAKNSFTTEYAGSLVDLGMDVAMAISFDPAEYAAVDDHFEFLVLMNNADIPESALLHSIINKYIPQKYPEGVPEWCYDFKSAYAGPGNGFGSPIGPCLWNNGYEPAPGWTFQPAALANELETKVFAPARIAAEFAGQYTYLTKFYGKLNPIDMQKDPYFTLRSDLPDVSNIHTAIAIPQCENLDPVALDITAGESIFTVPAKIGCNRWEPLLDSSGGPDLDQSPALEFFMWGYSSDEVGSIVVTRLGDGTFDPDAIDNAIVFGDSLVPDQTVPNLLLQDDSNVTVVSPFSGNSADYQVQAMGGEAEELISVESGMAVDEVIATLPQSASTCSWLVMGPLFWCAMLVLCVI